MHSAPAHTASASRHLGLQPAVKFTSQHECHAHFSQHTCISLTLPGAVQQAAGPAQHPLHLGRLLQPGQRGRHPGQRSHCQLPQLVPAVQRSLCSISSTSSKGMQHRCAELSFQYEQHIWLQSMHNYGQVPQLRSAVQCSLCNTHSNATDYRTWPPGPGAAAAFSFPAQSFLTASTGLARDAKFSMRQGVGASIVLPLENATWSR